MLSSNLHRGEVLFIMSNTLPKKTYDEKMHAKYVRGVISSLLQLRFSDCGSTVKFAEFFVYYTCFIPMQILV